MPSITCFQAVSRSDFREINQRLQEGETSIVEKDLKTNGDSEPRGSHLISKKLVEAAARQTPKDPSIPDVSSGEHAKAIKSKQRAVGKARSLEYLSNDGCVLVVAENTNGREQDQAEPQLYALPDAGGLGRLGLSRI